MGNIYNRYWRINCLDGSNYLDRARSRALLFGVLLGLRLLIDPVVQSSAIPSNVRTRPGLEDGESYLAISMA